MGRQPIPQVTRPLLIGLTYLLASLVSGMEFSVSYSSDGVGDHPETTTGSSGPLTDRWENDPSAPDRNTAGVFGGGAGDLHLSPDQPGRVRLFEGLHMRNSSWHQRTGEAPESEVLAKASFASECESHAKLYTCD